MEFRRLMLLTFVHGFESDTAALTGVLASV